MSASASAAKLGSQMTYQHYPHLSMYGSNVVVPQHDPFSAYPQSHYTDHTLANHNVQQHTTQQDLDNNNQSTMPKDKSMLQRNNGAEVKREQPRQITKGIANSILLAPRTSKTINCEYGGVVFDRLSDRTNKVGGGSPRTRIAIATDSVLSPAKKHIAKVFLKHGVTGSFSPNLDKLVEITGNMGLLFQSYKDYCTKRHLKTVNKETYARLFRNEFKRKVGAR